jgi:hypothetical protein
MRDSITTGLDVVGLLLVAAGVGASLWQVAGPVALVASGGLLLAGSWLAARR